MKRVHILDRDKARLFFGQYGQPGRELEKEFGVTIAGRGSEVIIKGARRRVLAAQAAIEERLANLERGTGRKTRPEKTPGPGRAREAPADPAGETPPDEIFIGSKRRSVAVRTPGQQAYVDAVRENDIVVAIGPAGTGKTYLAVALAMEQLRRKTVERIVISRPAMEAGEKLGFLPGDLEEKIGPYLQPIYDALYDLAWPEDVRRLIDHRVIEILPLAYMRGRTLSEAFIILDEAQNATPEQMKMFLTRTGMGSRAVVTGDTTQSDLPAEQTSGLIDIENLLKTVPGISFVYLDESDVVRHPLVREIILAYEKRHKSRDLPGKPAEKDAAGHEPDKKGG